MSDLLSQLSHIEKATAIQLLNKTSDFKLDVHLKLAHEQRIIMTKLQRLANKRQFFLTDKLALPAGTTPVTIKIIIEKKLFFLKTDLRLIQDRVYFDECENLFELIRRKKPRFEIPENWSQVAKIQSIDTPAELKANVSIQEMSAAGMKLKVRPELPRYEKNQNIKVQFKVYRRAEVSVNAKIIHVSRAHVGGPVIGVEFFGASKLIENKIQNVCDDLAFFYAAELSTS